MQYSVCTNTLSKHIHLKYYSEDIAKCIHIYVSTTITYYDLLNSLSNFGDNNFVFGNLVDHAIFALFSSYHAASFLQLTL